MFQINPILVYNDTYCVRKHAVNMKSIFTDIRFKTQVYAKHATRHSVTRDVGPV